MSTEHVQAVRMVARIEAIPGILQSICGLTGMGFAAVARVTDTEWVAYAVRDEIDFGLRPGGSLELDTTICHQIRQSGQAVLIPDTRVDPFYCEHLAPQMYGFASYASYPITLADGGMWGTLCAIDPQPRDIGRPEIDNLFRMFADLIGFHLNLATRLVQSEATLDEEVALGLQREQFIAVLGHDLRNPLAAVQAGVAMLRKRPAEDRAALVLDRMQASIGRMALLVNDILDFSRGRLGEGIILKSIETDVVALVRQVTEELASIHPEHDIVIEGDPVILAWCDPQRIAQLFSNLVGNALTHGARDQRVKIACGTTDDGLLEISVANGGRQIAERDLAKLFDPYERGGQGSTSDGLGLGLYIASMIASAHQGTLTVTSSTTETRFTFCMKTTFRAG